ncbi:TPM domain-containing protein [Nodularia chucula]|uniref:TPM domain-containing protein n=1 Tax=Nodularia chucula TaxID=3093667 RepID=UPI0039C5B3BA
MKLTFLKPKRIFLLGIFSASIVLAPLSSLALKVEEVPNPRQVSGGWVTDMADILNNETEAEINQMIADLEAKNGTEIAVVTVPTTSPAPSPKSFATELFNHWGIGKQGEDNGVLFLISVGDRRVEIETGYGIEAILPDAKVGNIINSQIIPEFKQGDFAGGTLAGTKALVLVLGSDPNQAANLVRTEVTPNKTEVTPNNFSNNSGPGVFAVMVRVGMILIIGGLIFLVVRPVKIPIKPEGYTRKKQRRYKFLCADCQQPMTQVDPSIIEPHLTIKEKTAKKIGSVKFEGWKCLNCSQQSTSKGFHLVAQESESPQFKECPHCQELTVIRTEKTIKQPTQYRSGKRLIIDDCHCCTYHNEMEEKIPRLPPPPPPPASSSSSGSFGGGSFGGGGGCSGGSSGGHYGGGSSGGGGAGGSW